MMNIRILTLSIVIAFVVSACAAPAAPTPAPVATSQAPAAPKAAPSPTIAQPTAPTPTAAAKPAPAPTATQPPAASKPPAKAAQKVRMGPTGLISGGPIYIAMEKGYFKEAGIEPDLATTSSAGDVMAPLAAGQLDVVGGGINIGTFNAVGRGLPILVVADRAYLSPGADGDIWMVRSDLVDQIKSVQDLKGRKIAVNSPSSPLIYMIGKTLENHGMKLQDVETVAMPFPDMVAAFRNKAIEVAIEVEPFVVQIEEGGFAKAWFEVSKETGPMETGVVFFNADWAKQNRDLANEFMVALLRGARDYYSAMNRGPNRAEVVSILTKHTTTKDAALYDKMRWIGLNPDGLVDVASVKDQIDWYVKAGLLKESVAIDKVIDHSFAEYAIKKLGKYQR